MKKNDIFRDLLTCHGLLYLIVLLLTGFRFDYALASPLNDHGSRAVQKMKKYCGAVNCQPSITQDRGMLPQFVFVFEGFLIKMNSLDYLSTAPQK